MMAANLSGVLIGALVGMSPCSIAIAQGPPAELSGMTQSVDPTTVEAARKMLRRQFPREVLEAEAAIVFIGHP